jgi:hypothetical protein
MIKWTLKASSKSVYPGDYEREEGQKKTYNVGKKKKGKKKEEGIFTDTCPARPRVSKHDVKK